MDYNIIFSELRSNKTVFEKLLGGLEPEQYLWKEAEGKWCLLEILCHLCDEEVEDFRTRVKITLNSPGKTPPAIDPVGWVKDRNYISQNFNKKLDEFINERQKSVDWLNSLEGAMWSNYYDHPKLGRLSAHLFLSNWLAHDFLHIRQIIRIKRAYLMHLTTEDLSYAGNW